MRMHWSADAAACEWGNAMRGEKHLFLYGASKFADSKWLVTILEQLGDALQWPIAFVDRNETKQLKGFRGFKVISPARFYEMDTDKAIVVLCVTPRSRDEVVADLRAHGFEEGRNLFSDFQFLTQVLPGILAVEKGYSVDVFAEY